MFKLKSLMPLFIFLFACSHSNIPEKAGNWRVEVGPAGNEFYETPVEKKAKLTPPSDELIKIVKSIAPDYTEISRWEMPADTIYFIRAQTEYEEYDFSVSVTGHVYELTYDNDSTNISEEPDKLVLKGTKTEITEADIPVNSLKIIKKVMHGATPSQYWQAKTVAGQRYVVQTENTVFYIRPDGQIQALGIIEQGALDEIAPPESKKEKTNTEILAEAEQLLSPYREKFDFQNQIHRLGRQPGNRNGHYRFIVMGDSRSNRDLWVSELAHINQLDPKPVFIINSGDIVPHGYSKEYLEYYIPPLKSFDIPMFIALGNHDDGNNAQALEYRYLFGDSSLNYYFDYGQARFIFFDNCTSIEPTEKKLAWLEATLASTPAEFHKYVAAHKPPETIKKWAYHAWDSKNSKIFTDLMTQYQVDHVFFGHIHAYSTATYNGVHYTLSGGGGAGLHDRFGPLGNVHHYVIFDVRPDGTVEQQVVRFYKNNTAKK